MQVPKCAFVTACVALLASAAFPYPGNPLGLDANWLAPKAMTPPVLDGDLADWQGATSFRVSPSEVQRIGDTYGWTNEEQTVTVSAANRLADHTGEEGAEAGTDADLDATLHLMYDDDNLYFAGDVIDNIYDVTGYEVEDPEWACMWWGRDGIAIFLDIPDDGDGLEYLLGDMHFALTATDQSVADWTVSWRGAAPEPGSWAYGNWTVMPGYAATFGFQKTSYGHIIEAALPIDSLTVFTPEVVIEAGTTIGMGVLIPDPDGGDQYGGQIEFGMSSEDDSTWGELTFSDQVINNHPSAVQSTSWGQIKSNF